MATNSDVAANPLHDLTGFQRDLLTLIQQLDSPHGLAIKAEMEAAYDGKEVNHGRLYPNLDTLVEKGLVEKVQADRRTNNYSLTTRGRRELSEHCSWMGADDAE